MAVGITRRRMLALLCVASGLSFGVIPRPARALFINGHIDPQGRHHISGFDDLGKAYFTQALPDKAHGFAVHPVRPERLVALPTLPGTRAPVFDVAAGRQIALIESQPGRHFYGHGCFSHDGQYLFTNENIIDTAEGVITVRDGETFAFIRELPSSGIGPHDLRLLPDGRTLVVAGGGLRTHPSSGKRELNINEMDSALLFIDSRTGERVAERRIPVDKLSIRHLDVGADGTILIACQYKGRREMPKLVGMQQGQGDIEMLSIDDDELWPLRNYTASARIASNGIGAVSCPRGNRLTFWDLQQKRYLSSIAISDVGGLEVSPDGDAFIASANTGELYHIDATTLTSRRMGKTWKQARWTNHMTRVNA